MGVIIAGGLWVARSDKPFTSAQVKPAAERGTFFGAKETEYPRWFKESFLDFKEDLAEASKNNKRLLLMFTQNGCPYCNALVERNLSQADIEALVRAKFDVIAINMWGDRHITAIDGQPYNEKTFAETLKVQFTPTLVFFNEQGEIVLRLNGYLPPDKFKLAVSYVAGKHEQHQSYQDYLAANNPSINSGSAMLKEDFFLAAPYPLTRSAGSKAKPLAVFFEQRDCPNCDTLHQKILVDPDTRKLIAQFDAVQLDMWSDSPVTLPAGNASTARQWAKQLDIKFAPTIVLFNPEGKEIIRSEAFFKVFHTQGIFDYVLSGAYRQQPSFQRYLSGRADHLREQGKDVDIWRLGDETTTAAPRSK
ncbi:MAG: thioredoxin fold domain-containing protein [Gammaproteobacteria bacterium]|nr:thioredoxin fold domain-containing protein [Gammaproteobacteria bacterium]